MRRGAVVDGIAITDMTKEQLEGHIYNLQNEIEKEREERNYYQVERDKICEFWNITKQHLREKEAELQVKDKKLEEAELAHLAEIKVYKEKLKHIMLEYQNHVDVQTQNHMVAMKIADEEHHCQETILWREKNQLKMSMNQMKAEHNDFVRLLKLEHSKELANMRQDYEEKLKFLKNKHSEVLDTLKQELDEAKNKEIQEIEETKNRQIENLTANHEKLFIDMKNYYNDITQNNLSLIATMKDQINMLSKKEKRLEKEAEAMSQKNEVLSRQLRASEEEATSLQKKVEYFEREKDHYISAQNKMKELSAEVKHLKWDNDLLVEKLKKVESERDSLYSKFKSAIQTVEEKIGMKAVLLEKKIEFLKQGLEQKKPVQNDPSKHPSHQGLEVNEELLRALDNISHNLGLTTRPSGAHTGMP